MMRQGMLTQQKASFTARAMVGRFQNVSCRWNEMGQLTIPVEAGAAEDFIGAFKKIRAFFEHKLFRDDAFHVLNLYTQIKIFFTKVVMRYLHVDKLPLEVGYFLPELLIVHLFRKLDQGRYFSDHTINYVHHILHYT
jgi:hypothetical protein